MAELTNELKEKLKAQAIKEIAFSRRVKQGKVLNWQKNENAYYGKKPIGNEARANVELGRMQEFVHTLLSKIDNPLIFKFTKRKLSQLKRVDRLNALRLADSQQGYWDLKDIVGKKQAIIYGRAIYMYYADSADGNYKSHLDPIDIYDFLNDPAGGGMDVEKMRFMGAFGVVKDKYELQEGVKAGIYDKDAVNLLVQSNGNSTDLPQEEVNKRNRIYATNITLTLKEVGDDEKYKFWQWFTTYEGKRYYLLMNDRTGGAIRACELKDMFETNLWPVWTWAAFPDMTEFWTPSYCDYVRENFYAQNVSINQLLDNAEAINKPQKVVNVSAIENEAELKYRRDGWIRTKNAIDANKVVQILQTPSIQTPIEVFNLLEAIAGKASGVDASAAGVETNNSGAKATIYNGNMANLSDRFGLLNKSYSFGYKRFAKLYEAGVRENLVKKTAIEILGRDGIEDQMIGKSDVFKKDDKYGVMVEASNAEEQTSLMEKQAKVQFLAGKEANPSTAQIINMKKSFEIQARAVDISEDDIKQLLDLSEFGDAEILSQADNDIEQILAGKQIKPYSGATTAYKLRIADYMAVEGNNLNIKEFQMLEAYVASLTPVIQANMARKLAEIQLKQAMAQSTNPMPQDGSQGQPEPQTTPQPLTPGMGNGNTQQASPQPNV